MSRNRIGDAGAHDARGDGSGRKPLLSDDQLREVGVVRVTPDLCRKCWVREHVPCSDYCRACRYHLRGKKT